MVDFHIFLLDQPNENNFRFSLRTHVEGIVNDVFHLKATQLHLYTYIECVTRIATHMRMNNIGIRLMFRQRHNKPIDWCPLKMGYLQTTFNQCAISDDFVALEFTSNSIRAFSFFLWIGLFW